MRLLGATETILPYAQAYAQYISVRCAGHVRFFVLNNILRSQGRATLSMIGIATGAC